VFVTRCIGHRMQRLTAMVYCNLSRSTTACVLPSHSASRSLSETYMRGKLLKRHAADNLCPSSGSSHALLSYKQSFMRELHVSCIQRYTGRQPDVQPDEQLVNICHFLLCSSWSLWDLMLTYIHRVSTDVPLSPGSVIWYEPKNGDGECLQSQVVILFMH